MHVFVLILVIGVIGGKMNIVTSFQMLSSNICGLHLKSADFLYIFS